MLSAAMLKNSFKPKNQFAAQQALIDSGTDDSDLQNVFSNSIN